MALTADEFNYIRKFIQDYAGIVLDKGKEYLVESRLFSLAHQLKFDNAGKLIVDLQKRRTIPDPLQIKLIDALTTHETSFFRDKNPFEVLRKNIIPKLIEKRNKTRKLNIWCAACSTGQEPYSIAMLLQDTFPALSEWHVTIKATDISQRVLQKARKGIYSHLDVHRGMPSKFLRQYFIKDGSSWQVKENIRSMINFEEINLVKKWPWLPQMDIIFLRNVLLYFNVESKKKILQKLQQILRNDGYLILGSSESTLNIDPAFHVSHIEKTSCYQLNPNKFPQTNLTGEN